MSIIGHFHAAGNFIEERSHLFNKVKESINIYEVLVDLYENGIAFGSGLNLGIESRSSHESFNEFVSIGEFVIVLSGVNNRFNAGFFISKGNLEISEEFKDLGWIGFHDRGLLFGFRIFDH